LNKKPRGESKPTTNLTLTWSPTSSCLITLLASPLVLIHDFPSQSLGSLLFSSVTTSANSEESWIVFQTFPSKLSLTFLLPQTDLIPYFKEAPGLVLSFSTPLVSFISISQLSPISNEFSESHSILIYPPRVGRGQGLVQAGAPVRTTHRQDRPGPWQQGAQWPWCRGAWGLSASKLDSWCLLRVH
jgi:hypothetical protein